MMKRIIGIFLCAVTVFLMLPVPAVRAIPSSGNVVQQMGGPVSSKFSLKIEDIVERYSGWQTYEARFYPFGEGGGMPVFIGTAHHVQEIKKTDAEIAYLDAMEKAGTDEYSLKKFHEYVQKYEATCQTSAEVLSETIYDVSKTALSAAGFVVGDIVGDAVGTVAGEAAGHVVGAASLATGVWDNSESLAENGVNADVIASIGFTLGDLAGLAGGILGVSALAMVGTVAAVGGIGYTMFQKHMEHQEQWKDFANYLMGRRNLTEFFKYLEAELLEKMKDTSGWDIQFNPSEFVDEDYAFWEFPAPMTYTFQGRFMYNYVPEFEFGQVTNPNEDGWAGNLELDMEIDLSAFTNGWAHSMHCLVNDDVIAVMQAEATKETGNELKIWEPFYWNSHLSCLNFPLKTDSMDPTQSQIVFTGSLAGASYIYNQGGKVHRYYSVIAECPDEDGNLVKIMDWRTYDCRTLTKEGFSQEWEYYLWLYTGDTQHEGETNITDYGDILNFELWLSYTEAKLVIDITKPLSDRK